MLFPRPLLLTGFPLPWLLAALLVSLCWPVSAQFRESKLSAIDRAIELAISKGSIPGAVLRIESKGEVYEKAYGRRMTRPGSEEMTLDTIFDVASLTKVLATTPSILMLLEDGALSLDEPISTYLPEFLEGGVRPEPVDPEVTSEDREKITLRHLLTHQSGLPPGIFLTERDFWGHEQGITRAIEIGLIEKPGSRFRYSDVNFILLGEIVRRVGGQRLDIFAQDYLYEPLGMLSSGFLPRARALPAIAPTTEIEGYGLLRGVVHDPTARRMEGVGGHAGLFSTAEDIAIFLRMMLNEGRHGERELFASESIDLALKNHMPEAIEHQRGLGWDLQSSFSYQRGNKFPLGGFGHTGWTGTSIWVDPESETMVILLANRNHPTEAGRIKALRIEVGTLAAEAVGYTAEVEPVVSTGEFFDESSLTAAAAPAVVLNGIDVLERDGFGSLAGKKIGLITNHTGINRARRATIDIFAEAAEVDLVALFAPEHGIRGTSEEDSIADGRDARTGLPVYSLYKASNRSPTSAQLAEIDVLVFDIQDIGCRFYTYISTMGLAMEAAAENGKPFVVLDRVNPIGGTVVDGPIRSGEGNDFVAFHEIPVQHGMTVGELAKMFNKERRIGADLTVVPISGWNRKMRFDSTGLPWINPSPNMRSLTEAMLYPGVGLIEFTNLSVGRGTATPFEHVGAPWIHDGRLAAALQSDPIPGLMIMPTRFTPNASKYQNEDCAGVRFILTDADSFRPLDLGISLMRSIQRLYPDTFDLAERGNVLLRDEETLEAALSDKERSEIRKLWKSDLQRFLKRRAKFLLY
ncbi:MAG: exo-beta-N-acetylmuramidase NamZ domain-containing protein [Verrucomicrobiota bacterium]